MSPQEENLDSIRALLQHYPKVLTVWEDKFLRDLDGADCLTMKQQEKLDEIWLEVVVSKREEEEDV